MMAVTTVAMITAGVNDNEFLVFVDQQRSAGIVGGENGKLAKSIGILTFCGDDIDSR